MATTPFEIIAGPANVWVAPVAEAYPDVDDAPAGNWSSLGQTDGGVSAQHSQSINLLMTDQSSGPRKAIRTEEHLVLSMVLAEITLERLAKVLNNVAVTSAGGPPATKSIPLHAGFDVARFALLVRGPSPYLNANMDYRVPIVVQTEEPELVFTRENKVGVSTRWEAIEDTSASTESERFGVLIAQSA